VGGLESRVWPGKFLPAFIFAAVALAKIKHSPRPHGGKGVALAGIVTGGLGCVIGTVVLMGTALPVLEFSREKSRLDECKKKRRRAPFHGRPVCRGERSEEAPVARRT
jgi:endonuclease V-like protein UPF0215 family